MPAPPSRVASPQRPSAGVSSFSRSAAARLAADAVVEAWTEHVSTSSGLLLPLSVRRSSHLRQLHRFALLTLHPAASHSARSSLPSLIASFVSREFGEGSSTVRNSGLALAFHALKSHEHSPDAFTLLMVFDDEQNSGGRASRSSAQMHEWVHKFDAAVGTIAADCSFIEMRPAHWR